jgi:hypothetical protein
LFFCSFVLWNLSFFAQESPRRKTLNTNVGNTPQIIVYNKAVPLIVELVTDHETAGAMDGVWGNNRFDQT